MKRKGELCIVIFTIAVIMTLHYLVISILNLPDDVVLLRGTKIDL